jgi:hypothetical protein
LGAYGYAFTLTSGQHEEDNNFGNYMYATKSGYKWNDLLDDGEWDQVNEPALPGWTIELWDVTGTPVPAASTTTDGNGAYAFSGLMPGKTYAVCEVLNAFYVQTFPSASTPDPDPPKEVIFDCTVLGANYGPFGYQFYAESGDEFTLNNFGNMEPQGCTYTQGYWKTHSEYGPAAHPDEGWYTTFGPYPPGVDGPEGPILDGPDAPLFGSGLTWLEAFNHPPKAGNAWFILAHQWMAAYLNFYNGGGAGGTDVVQWLGDGADLLIQFESTSYKNFDAPFIPPDEPERAAAIELAGWLGDYNEGIIGPGHCD